MKKYESLCILISIVFCMSCTQKQYRINLSGDWQVRIDSTEHTIKLPGSLTERGIGIPVTDSSTQMLSEPVTFVGKAIYKKEIIVPNEWENKYVELFIERTKVSEVFVNDSLIGVQKSVSAPHAYLMQNMFKPGVNHLTITVDNTKSLLPLGGSHAYSEHTQTNWNGILGDFYLKCLQDIDIRNMQITALTNGKCNVKLEVLNTTVNTLSNKAIQVSVSDSKGKEVLKKTIKEDIAPGYSSINLDFEIQNPILWDEYNPDLYVLKTEIEKIDSKEVKFGIRDFATHSGQFVNNNRIVFLRGTHEGGVFPLTGYPSIEKKDWVKYFSIVKSYGLNHVRYHSWTPPKAAFEAADEKGVFLQPELPFWGNYNSADTSLINYMKSEGEKIMESYGNHPSFVMFALGNELTGDTASMAGVVNHLKQIDNRHLYALGSNNLFWDGQTHPIEDFYVGMRHGTESADNHTDLRGSFSFADSQAGGIINRFQPNSTRNFSKAIERLGKPAIGHETGQYQIYPNFEEIKKYTGVMQPRNFEVFRKRLEKAKMLNQANDFLKASGALAALCYREDIEMALRTPKFGGFQLLDLKDYPGQGTALVGILDVFMESKDIISREKWTEFCNDIVPLALFSKYCWRNNEIFTADIEIAHYGRNNLNGQDIHCTLSTQNNEIIYEKTFLKQELKEGILNKIATITIPLNTVTKNQKLLLTIKINNTNYKNSWDIWVYKNEIHKIEEGYFGDVLVTRNKNLCLQKAAEGNSIIYIPMKEDVNDVSVGGLFITDFWNYAMFKPVAINNGREPSSGTIGLLMDPKHELFDLFPTDFHTNWQWWNIVKKSNPVILDSFPESYKPIVQVIDNFDRNHKLGLIYEMPDTKGRVLVCAADIFSCKDEPEVQALFESMLNYLHK